MNRARKSFSPEKAFNTYMPASPRSSTTRSTRSKSPILEVVGLTVRRGSTTILDDISWRVERGQHWVMLGANGSGKTSLLAALTGYLTPTAGEFSVLGRSFGETDWRELRTRIGLVSSAIRQLMPDDAPALDIVLGGRRALIGLWGGVSKSERQRAKRILQSVECHHLAARPWLYLSQGERQRVLLGRALMSRCRLLFLDEPCAGLDPAAREHFLQFLQQLGRRVDAPALVLVTHHVEEITPVFGHVLILKAGRVLTQGTKEFVLTSKNLGAALAAKVRLSKMCGRFTLNVAPNRRKIV